MERGLETLAIFARFCHANGLSDEDVHVFATSAIRDAGNRDGFLRQVHETTGYEVEVLSTKEEAHYGYVAAINSTTLADGVVLDIGGGSMQLIQVEDRLEGASVSLPIGAVRVTGSFLSDGDPGRPVRKKDLQRLREHVAGELAAADWLGSHGGRLVGTGGAVRNL